MQLSKLTVLLESIHHLVVNKNPSMFCQPPMNRQFYNNTVLHTLQEMGYDQQKLFPINRLDFNVSGCVCIGRSKIAAQQFSKNMKGGKWSNKGFIIDRKYVGLMEPIKLNKYLSQFKKLPLVEDDVGLIDVIVDGKQARTKYQIIDSDDDLGRKLVALRLLTGRKHQIRIHLNHLGYSIVGDYKHGYRNTSDKTTRLDDLPYSAPIALHGAYMRNKIGMKEYETFAPLQWSWKLSDGSGLWDWMIERGHMSGEQETFGELSDKIKEALRDLK